MDLATEMLTVTLQINHPNEVVTTRLQPVLPRRFGRLPWLGRRSVAFNADRIVGRMWDYPRYLRPRRGDFDYFHVGDHSYAQLVHTLPAGRTGVYCHDLDAFRCLLEPRAEPRPCWFRWLARRVLRGLQKATVVFHSTRSVYEQIVRHGLIDPARLVHAPYGIAPEFRLECLPSDLAVPVLEPWHGAPYVLHVGSCIPRKRIDILLEVFAALRGCQPELKLLQVGGSWTGPQTELLARLGLETAVHQVRGLDRAVLAALYRQARMVLFPSEAEGFGLPVVEALACGAPVTASDLPVLREVGGAACSYCPVGDVPHWVATVRRGLKQAPSSCREQRLAQAARYSWTAHARTILAAYQRLP
jgi:glycosyltransferase involved in cell wall biosynthesis